MGRRERDPAASIFNDDDELVGMDEVRARGLVVVRGEVFDLGAFSSRHRGGDFLGRLRGTDATFSLLNAHGVQGELTGAGLRAVPARLRVGRVDESTLPSADRAFHALHADLLERGFFAYRRSWLVVDALRMIALFAIGFIAARVHPLAGYIALTLAYLNVMWWVHDVCHDSVFATKRTAKRWAELASMVFVGTPVLDYQYKTHRIHHAFTNVIGGDGALETGPIIWDARMLRRTNPLLVRLQALLWFGIALPLTFPLFLGMAIYRRAKAKDVRKIALTVLRWGLVVVGAHFAGISLSTIVIPLLASGFLLAFFSSLNHFHLPMSENLDRSFVRGVASVSQNMAGGPLASRALLGWLVGGLDFHIEHHLFSTMPRRNYPRIAPRVQALFAEHDIAYNTCTLGEAIAQLVRKVHRPLGPAAPHPERRPIFRHAIDAYPAIAITASVGLALSAVLGHVEGTLFWWLVVPSIIGRLWGPVFQHNHSHLRVFRGGALNHALDFILGLATGHTAAIWEIQHGLGHHRHALDPKNDVAGNHRFRFTERCSVFVRRLVFTVLADALAMTDSWRVAAEYPKKRRALRIRLGWQVALQIACLGVLVVANPWGAFVAFVVPTMLLRWFVFWVSFAQHEGVPNNDVYDGSMTHYGLIGRILLNVGYHTAHHEKPTLHWSLLAKRTAQIRDRIPPACTRGIPDDIERVAPSLRAAPAAAIAAARASASFVAARVSASLASAPAIEGYPS